MTCDVAPSGAITVRLLAPAGTYKPWWSEVEVELVTRLEYHSGKTMRTEEGWSIKESYKGKVQTFTLAVGK